MEDFDKINAVDRMQRYILSHIDDEITMQDLSNVAGYSMWYSLRIFKELSNKTSFEFIRAVRLTKAAKLLRDGDENILDVALDNGFDSHDGFTRAFNRQFEITPCKYRKQTPPVSYFTYYPLRDYYLYMNKKDEVSMEAKNVSSTVTVTAVARPTRKMIILRSISAQDYFSYCEEVGCDWEGMLNSVPEKFDNAALITLPQSLVEAGTSATAAGIEVPSDYAKRIPESYELIDLPACTMLYFQGMPFEKDSYFCDAIDIVMEAIENYQPQLYGYSFADDIAPCYNFGASAESGAKMAVPVRVLKP